MCFLSSFLVTFIIYEDATPDQKQQTASASFLWLQQLTGPVCFHSLLFCSAQPERPCRDQNSSTLQPPAFTPFSPCPATGDQLEGYWICGWGHSAEGAGVSTQLFLSVLPLGRAPGIALVLLLALMLVRLHTQNCSGSLLCCITELCRSPRPSRAATGVGPKKLYPNGSRNPLLPLPFQFPVLRLH